MGGLNSALIERQQEAARVRAEIAAKLYDIRRRTCEAISMPVQNVWSQPEKVVEPLVVNGKVYTERDILDLLANIDSLTKDCEKLELSNEEMGEAISRRDQDNKEKDDFINELILENKEFKERLGEKTSVVAMKIGGHTYTRDEIVQILTMGTIYKQFFDSYCKGMEAGE